MHIASAEFYSSAPDLASCPDEALPEFAFIGRSNVGKSSLLNVLAGRDGLARVSPTPGFTKLINFFTINRRWRLVDLPGYGFAEVARKDKARFNQAVAEYLAKRPNLKGLFLLIDSSLPPQRIDLEFVQWLAGVGAPIVIVFTKIDRVSPAKATENQQAFLAELGRWFSPLPETFACSSVTGAGRGDLLGVISQVLAEIPEPVQAPDAAVQIAREEPKAMRARRAPWNKLT
jgi:GTP-binding protein